MKLCKTLKDCSDLTMVHAVHTPIYRETNDACIGANLQRKISGTKKFRSHCSVN